MKQRINYTDYSKKSDEMKEINEAVESTEEKEVEEKEEKKEEKKEEEKEEEKIQKGKVTNCERVRIRINPSVDADVVSIIDKGTEVNILGDEKNFYKVSTMNETGFIMKDFITFI